MFKLIKNLLSKYRYRLISTVLELNGYTDYKKLHPYVTSNDCFEKILSGGIINIIKIYYEEERDRYIVCSALYKQGSDNIQYNSFYTKFKRYFNKNDINIMLKLTNTLFKYNSENDIVDDCYFYDIANYFPVTNSNIDKFISHFNGKVYNMYDFLIQTTKYHSKL